MGEILSTRDSFLIYKMLFYYDNWFQHESVGLDEMEIWNGQGNRMSHTFHDYVWLAFLLVMLIKSLMMALSCKNTSVSSYNFG